MAAIFQCHCGHKTIRRSHKGATESCSITMVFTRYLLSYLALRTFDYRTSQWSARQRPEASKRRSARGDRRPPAAGLRVRGEQKHIGAQAGRSAATRARYARGAACRQTKPIPAMEARAI